MVQNKYHKLSCQELLSSVSAEMDLAQECKSRSSAHSISIAHQMEYSGFGRFGVLKFNASVEKLICKVNYKTFFLCVCSGY